MKFKWLFPFVPTITFADPHPSHDLNFRVLIAIGALVMVGILLVIVQPWREGERNG